MTRRDEHYYAPHAADPASRVVCACGHVEWIDGDFAAALSRMNAHIRSSYTDEEWEAKMQEAKLATLDPETGDLKLPAEGPKS